MDTVDILAIAARGQDDKHQFTPNFADADSLAADLVAFSNSEGGMVLIGVNRDGTLSGLSRDDMDRLNRLVAYAAERVKPPIHPRTESVSALGVLVLVVHVLDSTSKPHTDSARIIWVKDGSSKRELTCREELQIMYQASEVLHGEETPATGLTVADVDVGYLNLFLHRNFVKVIDAQSTPLSTILRNMHLIKGDALSISGALLFARTPQLKLPEFIVKAAAYAGTEIDAGRCIESRDISGKIADMFYKSMGFVLAYLSAGERMGGDNASDKPLIPQAALEELIANALLHRDYFITAPIWICMFSNRVEIISPGHLHRNLTIENITHGVSCPRNPILVSFATKLLPYSGIENGIIRALKMHPFIEFKDHREADSFQVTIRFQT